MTRAQPAVSKNLMQQVSPSSAIGLLYIGTTNKACMHDAASVGHSAGN